jgi:YesN/AraC family two-component response regulator
MDKNPLKQKSIYRSWIFSYLLVLVVPIAIGFLIYIQATNIISSQINKTNEAMLTQVQLTVDAHVRDLDRIVKEISFKDDFKNIIMANEDLAITPKYITVEFQQKLNQYLQFNNFIDYLYVYLYDGNRIISSSSATDADIFYSSRYNTPDMPYDTWLTLMRKMYSNNVIKMSSSTPQKTELAYIQTAPKFNFTDNNSNIVLVINEQKIKDALSRIHLVNDSTIIILDKDNNVITSTQNNNWNKSLNYPELSGEGLSNRLILDNENVVITSIVSKQVPWKYISVTPEKVYMERTEYIRKITLFGFFFCLFLGGLLSYFFSKKNYFPLADLFKNVITKASKFASKNGNEYEIIKSAFEDIIETKNQIDKKLSSQKGVIRSNYLAKLLKGRFDSIPSIAEVLSTFDVTFDSDKFAVILFDIEDIEGNYKEKDLLSFNKDFQLTQFIIINISEEMYSEIGKAYGVEIDARVALLINLKNTQASLKDKISDVSKNIQDFIKENFKIHVTISISSSHETMIGIPKAYEEALNAMEYKMLSGIEKILCFDNLHEPVNFKYYYPLEIEQKLINCIKTREYDNIKEILDKVYKKNFDQEWMSIQMAKCLMFNLISTLNKAVSEVTSLKDDNYFETSNSMELLMRCDTIDGMKAQIEKIMLNVCEYIDIKTSSEETSMNEAIYRYIENNYKDSSLSVEKIADHFGKSRGYLFSHFKDETGEGLLYQINKVRIVKAKQLMLETKLSINEISEKVGIINVNSFIRIFKKYEGVTPGKYRELMGENTKKDNDSPS